MNPQLNLNGIDPIATAAAPLHYEPPTYTYRVMFNDGSTLDATAHGDDSRFRGWLLMQKYGTDKANKLANDEGIAAVVNLGEVAGTVNPTADGGA